MRCTRTSSGTVDLPDDLFVAARQRAASERTTLRSIVERGLRAQLGATARVIGRRRTAKWVTVRGGLPPGMDLTNRGAMHDWLWGTR